MHNKMDSPNSPYFCNFVGEQSIVCKCSDTFNNEEELQEHLANNHDMKNHDMEDSDTGIDDGSLDVSHETRKRRTHVKLTLPTMKSNKQKKKYLETLQSNDDLERLLNNQEKYNYKIVLLKNYKSNIKPSPKKYMPPLKEAKYNQLEVLKPNTVTAILASEQPNPEAEQLIPVKEEVICDNTMSPEEQTSANDETENNLKSEQQTHDCDIAYQQQEDNVHEYEVLKKEEWIETEEVYEDSNTEYDNETEIETKVVLQENKQSVYDLTFKCDKCDEIFTDAKIHIEHYRSVHRNQKEKHVAKDKHVAKEKPQLKRRRLKANELICTCGKKTATRQQLQYHQNTHTGEKPFVCPYCSRGFSTPMLLKIHVRIHTGERPFQCAVCPKAFRSRSALDRHDRVHTGVRPYACLECGKCFTQSNTMKFHVLTVHRKMPTPYKRKPKHANHAKLDDDTVLA